MGKRWCSRNQGLDRLQASIEHGKGACCYRFKEGLESVKHKAIGYQNFLLVHYTPRHTHVLRKYEKLNLKTAKDSRVA